MIVGTCPKCGSDQLKFWGSKEKLCCNSCRVDGEPLVFESSEAKLEYRSSTGIHVESHNQQGGITTPYVVVVR